MPRKLGFGQLTSKEDALAFARKFFLQELVKERPDILTALEEEAKSYVTPIQLELA